MPVNVEIKARSRDPAALEALVGAITDTPPQTLRQRDTFFRCPTGRLKLRESGAGPAELIWYDRANIPGSRRSDYAIAPIADPTSLRDILGSAYGLGQVVEKTRLLYRVGQTRIHLDDVVGLGRFVELEVVLHVGQTESDGHAIAADLMTRLGIAATDLLDRSYAELLAETGTGTSY